MPPFLWCNPIIDWDYGNVWEFLRHPDLRGKVPYCSLNDAGFGCHVQDSYERFNYLSSYCYTMPSIDFPAVPAVGDKLQ